MSEQVWIEKYRPKTLDEIVGQKEIIRRLKSYVVTRNMPHILFSGPPGVGKTAAAVSLTRELFGDLWMANFMELNASDENGIRVVREKIKDFARSSTIGDADFKIIFLDESDALTPDAQSALRRTMEKYTNICRFILSCNYPSKIIEPIQSRCSVYKFKHLLNKAVEEKIEYIANKEGITLTREGMDAIIYVAEGDMRRAINALQSAAGVDKNINGESIFQVAYIVKPEDIMLLIQTCLSGQFLKAKAKLDELLYEGYTGDDIIKQMYRVILNMNIQDKKKVVLIDNLGEINFRISEGANENLQLGTLISKFVMNS